MFCLDNLYMYVLLSSLQFEWMRKRIKATKKERSIYYGNGEEHAEHNQTYTSGGYSKN
jgi:hypothetical protein